MFAAMTHLIEELNLETLLVLKVEKSVICLVGTQRTIISTTEQQPILFMKTVIGKQMASKFCRLE
jgi:hypothetical protein